MNSASSWEGLLANGVPKPCYLCMLRIQTIVWLSEQLTYGIDRYCVIGVRCVWICRLWDVDCGACLRILEGHEELVRCIRFDNKRIVSGAYDGLVSHLSAVCCSRWFYVRRRNWHVLAMNKSICLSVCLSVWMSHSDIIKMAAYSVKLLSNLMGPSFCPSMLWHCWLVDTDSKGIWPVKSWMLVCWWWFDWSLARPTAPVVTTISIVLAVSN